MSDATKEAMKLIRRFFNEEPDGDLIAAFVPGARASVSAALRRLHDAGEIEVAYESFSGNNVWRRA